MNVLLMGNPNVGKSVIFSRLTGIRVVASNYPGTTVEFSEGTMRLGDEEARLIDVPGTYSLDAAPSKAEEVALRMLDEGDVVVNVVDATNLERNLQLTLELIERAKPMLVALNVWDDARHKGIEIDCAKLEEFLGVPVVPTVGITGEGVKDLVARIPDATVPSVPERWKVDRWSEIGRIVGAVQSLKHRHHTFLEWLGDMSVRPTTGLPIALVMLTAIFFMIRYIGEFLVGSVMEPLLDWAWMPGVERLFNPLGGGGWWVDAYGEMLTRLRKDMPPGCMLTTECNAEPYVRWFDGYLTWHWRISGTSRAWRCSSTASCTGWGSTAGRSSRPSSGWAATSLR